jgi:hypothetical protein
VTRTRLSRGGDYVAPEANVVARALFIDAVGRLVPEALEALQAVAIQLPDGSESAAAWDSTARPLRDWCRKYGFTATPWAHVPTDTSGSSEYIPDRHDWLFDLARRAAQWLRTNEDSTPAAKILRMCVGGSYSVINLPDPPRWDNIDVETEAAFKARQKNYRDEVKRLAIKAGRVPARRVNEKRAVLAFEWLALFQVGRLEAADIRKASKSPRPSVDIIREEIIEAAKQAGVHRRKARRGRPPDV